jgi:hypothetical protein
MVIIQFVLLFEHLLHEVTWLVGGFDFYSGEEVAHHVGEVFVGGLVLVGFEEVGQAQLREVAFFEADVAHLDFD